MENRKLSTIVFIDIAGYTALMQKNEAKALSFLDLFKQTIELESPTHHGQIVQYFGDGCLLAFDSSWNAINAAMAMQKAFTAQELPTRIGMHLGDVIFEGNNAFGDGVNIASRIESLSIPGAILMSGVIRDQIKNKEGIQLSALGSFDFKNVDEPIEVFALANDDFVVPKKHQMKGKLKQPKKSHKGLKLMLSLVTIIILAGFFYWYKFIYENKSDAWTVPKLAVLEFVNIGDPPNNDFTSVFADKLISRLTGLQSLAVISRSSTTIYSKSNKSPKRIGKELDVDYVLEGTVRWSDETNGKRSVRISPNLVRVSDNKSVWSPQFDNDPNQLEEMHSQIINELLQSLDIAITAEEQPGSISYLSNNPLASDAYQKGMKAKPEGHGAEHNYRTAFSMFQQAVKIDKKFTMAWVMLSEVYKDLYWYGYEANPSTLDSAWSCVEKAKSLDPENIEVSKSIGDYYYRTRAYDKSLEAYSKAIVKRPNDTQLLQRIGELWRRQGFFHEALEPMEKALALDPYNVNSITELSWTCMFVGDFDRAFELQKQAKKYNPDAEWNHLMGAFILWCRGQLNDLSKARKLLQNVPNPQSSYPAWFWVTQSWFENDPKAIIRILKSLPVDAIELQHSYEPVVLIEGLANLNMGKTRAAKKDLKDAVEILEMEINKNPSDFRMHMALGLAYAGLGEKDLAIASGEQATKILPLEKDHLLGLDILYNLMRIHAILGSDDQALDVMSKLLSVPCQYRGFFFTANPEFIKLREYTQFQDLLDKQEKMRQKFKQEMTTNM